MTMPRLNYRYSILSGLPRAVASAAGGHAHVRGAGVFLLTTQRSAVFERVPMLGQHLSSPPGGSPIKRSVLSAS